MAVTWELYMAVTCELSVNKRCANLIYFFHGTLIVCRHTGVHHQYDISWKSIYCNTVWSFCINWMLDRCVMYRWIFFRKKWCATSKIWPMQILCLLRNSYNINMVRWSFILSCLCANISLDDSLFIQTSNCMI